MIGIFDMLLHSLLVVVEPDNGETDSVETDDAREEIVPEHGGLNTDAHPQKKSFWFAEK